MRDYVAVEVRAKEFQIVNPEAVIKLPRGAYKREWDIEGEKIKIYVAK